MADTTNTNTIAANGSVGASTSSEPARNRGSQQLDLLLLKAESYSRFILENQKRTQAMLQSQFSYGSPTGKDISSFKEQDDSKKRKSTGASTSSKKKRQKADADSTDSKAEPTLAPTVVDGNSSSVSGIQQPPNLIGGTLLPYQVEGLQWLLSLWENGLNGILADEMGLGKTIQIISLIAHLRHNKTAGPYLIVGPLATISNWEREFKKWLPSCPVLLYHGEKDERAELRKKFLSPQQQKSLDFPVVITNFEMCMLDRAHLERFVWQYIILDEGHRIKNRNCRLLRELKSIRSVSRLLLTGTPIQNTLDELWSLLNFCSPMIFDDLEVFQSWFDFKNIGKDTQVEDILNTEEQTRIVTKMHDILRPFVLRRLKKDVLKDRVPPKREVVVYCGMSSIQQEYYARVLDGTLREGLMEVGVQNAKNLSQINSNMNMRKVCNHPFLFGDLTDAAGNNLRYSDKGNFLIMASGKFRLLHRMLPRLKSEGHKVLIFSQMTRLMDILEDYLTLQEHRFVRFDGSTKLAERQQCIDEFNDPASGVFVFLISTRAGGLGINLTAADTVIIFDSDWNPHQDSQAQDRCHRIGQVSKVVTYRFLTSGSVEIDVMKKQISKKKLERLTIHGGDFRKAGRRVSEKVTVSDLRVLLEDDVKNLARKETALMRSKKCSSANSPAAVTSAAAVAELTAVGSSNSSDTVASSWIQKDISINELDLIMDRDLLFARIDTTATTSPTDGESLTATLLSSDDTSSAVDDCFCQIPIEGEMYDILTDGPASSSLLALD